MYFLMLSGVTALLHKGLLTELEQIQTFEAWKKVLLTAAKIYLGTL